MITHAEFENRSSFNGSRRVAALWVAGTGAFLIVAAAALFIAVRWNDIPDEAKLAVVFALTGAFLLSGHAIRERLPATGSVLFHLGAFLLPIDLAGLNVRIGWSPEEQLLAQGVLGAVAFWALGTVGDSVVLRRVAAASMVAVALGVGALTPVPASVALLVAALALAAAAPRSTVALVWAAGAGLAPVVVAVAGAPGLPRVAERLALGAVAAPGAAAVTGLIATAILAQSATVRREVRVAFLSFAVLGSSLATAWAGADPGRTPTLLVLPAAFLILQLAALFLRRDPFWEMPITTVALGGEILAAWPSLYAMLPVLEGTDAAVGGAWGLVALGWTAGAVRRLRPARSVADGPWTLLAYPAALTAVASVLHGTGSPAAAGAALLAVSAVAVATRTSSLDGIVLGGVLLAPLLAWGRPEVSIALAGLGTLVTTFAADMAIRRVERVRAGLAAGAGIAGLALGAVAGSAVLGPVPSTLAFVAGCWAMSAVLHPGDRSIANVARVAAFAALLPALGWEPHERLVVAAALVAVAVVDAVRLGERPLAFAAIVPLQAVVVDVGLWSGLSLPQAGVLLTVSAVVWLGLSEVASDLGRDALRTAGILAVTGGLLLSAQDAASFGAALLVSGGLGLVVALLVGDATTAHVSGVALVLGTWIEFATGGVAVAEAYVAPVAAYLLVAGAWARRTRPVNSWAAYAPPVAMLGAAAFIERFDDGPGWHALLAGAVGVTAVAAGGSRRLGGPLLVGTALLVAVVVHESFAVVAGVPTWAWLGLGGSSLLAAGIAMERADTSPVEVGRRVVDVLGTRFS